MRSNNPQVAAARCSCPVPFGQGTNTSCKLPSASGTAGRSGIKRCRRRARGRTQVESSPGPLLTSTIETGGGGVTLGTRFGSGNGWLK
jgi:hypothetical protein